MPLPSVAAINNIFGALVAGRFSADVFAPEVCAAAEKLVPLTVELWNKVQAKMLPTPAKFHYLFNMRELSKVFQGVVLAERDRFSWAPPSSASAARCPPSYLVALWRHECERVFCDSSPRTRTRTGGTRHHEAHRRGDGKNVVKQVEER